MKNWDILEEYIEDFSDKSEIIYSLLRDISGNQRESASYLDRVREDIKELHAALAVISEGSDSYRRTIRKSEELISFGLSLVSEVMDKVEEFLSKTDLLNEKLHFLIEKRTEINEIVENVSELNQASANTARNAEIKAYQAGSSGRGFEVVAEELGNLTGKSLSILEEMVEVLESLKDKSETATEKFEKTEKSLSNFREITENLESSTEEVQSKFSRILNASDELLSILEKVNTKRKGIETTADSLLSLSKDSSVQAGKINLILSQKESLGEVLSHHKKLYNYLAEHRLPEIEENIEQIEDSLGVIGNLNENSREYVGALNVSQIKKGINLEELENIEGMLEKIQDEMNTVQSIIKDTLRGANEGLESISRVKDFIENEEESMREIINIQEELSDVSKDLGRLVESADELVEQMRVISLYGKIESARIRGSVEGLDAIVEEMDKLSSAYSEVGEELWGFFNPVKEELKELSWIFQVSESTIKRLISLVDEITQSFQENREQIENLTSVSASIKPSLSKQQEILMRIEKSFKSIVNATEDNAERVNQLKVEMNEEKRLLKKIKKDNKWKDLSRINIIEKDKDKELRIFASGEPLTFDPAKSGDATSTSVNFYIHRGLFEFGISGGIHPFMIKEWEISEDALRWDFKIEQGVSTHSGEIVEAEDIKFSLERLEDGPNKFVIDPIDRIKVRSRFSLSLFLKNEFMPLAQNLATIGGSVISRNYEGNMDEKPSGIGPFKWVEWEKDERIVLERFEKYKLGTPYVSRLIYIFGDDALEDFKEGKVDVTSLSSEEAMEIKEDESLSGNLVRSDYLNTNYMGFNFERDDLPFADRKVRKALNYAVDKRALIDEIYSGLGRVSRGIFPPGLSAYNRDLRGYEYNREKARRLLREAGYSDGLPGVYTLTMSGTEANRKTSEFLKKSFGEIGVEIEVKDYPWGEFLKKAHDGDTEMFLLGWSADHGDPNNFLFPLFHSSTRGVGGNTIFYGKDEIDNAIERALKEIDPTKRREMYMDIEKKLVEDAPWVFLNHGVKFFLVSDRVFGYITDPLDKPHYEWMGVE